MPEHIKKKLQEEIQILEHELNVELPRELKKAVAMGDLSENAEYHMAKQRQEFVRARLGQLKKRVSDLSMINMNNIPRDRAALGSTVLIYDTTKGEEIEYKLVTSEESDVKKGPHLDLFADRPGDDGQESRRYGDRGHARQENVRLKF